MRDQSVLLKALGIAILLIVSMVAWYVVELTDEVERLRHEVTRLTIAVEINLGGDPFAEGPGSE